MKKFICVILAGILAYLPVMGQSTSGISPQTQQVTIFVPVAFGHVVELPDWLPRDVQEEIRTTVESLPAEFIQWSTLIVVVVIVVVVGIISYCLWRCAQMIPPSEPPPPPPDDPYPALLENRPHAFVYNLQPAPEYALEYCNDITAAQWQSICVMSGATNSELAIPPQSDKMFFRLTPR